MGDISILLLISFAVVAFLYSSVGHGGASGYLALLAIFAFDPEGMKVSALLLNIIVAGIAFYHYYQKDTFNWKLFLSFAAFSVPFAFIGSRILIDPSLYKIILGICLALAAARILGLGKSGVPVLKKYPLPLYLVTGAVIGLVSGLIGIGGGIILSPFLLLLAIAGMKETAAISAIFILVNSISGFMGAVTGGATLSPEIMYMVVSAIAGGSLGAYYGSKKFNYFALKVVLSGVLIFASIKLLMQ